MCRIFCKLAGYGRKHKRSRCCSRNRRRIWLRFCVGNWIRCSSCGWHCRWHCCCKRLANTIFFALKESFNAKMWIEKGSLVKTFYKILILMVLFFNTAPLHAQCCQTGDGAGYSTRDATVLSMMGWGVGLAVGIALLCGYLEQDTSHGHW